MFLAGGLCAKAKGQVFLLLPCEAWDRAKTGGRTYLLLSEYTQFFRGLQ